MPYKYSRVCPLFKTCLNALGHRKDLKTLAFPEKIGCGLGGGVWSLYLKLIKDFANTFNKKVIIVIYDSSIMTDSTSKQPLL